MSSESIATQIEAARAEFHALPTAQGEEEIERLEREQRKAERFARAEEIAAAQRRTVAAAEARDAARVERGDLLEQRTGIKSHLRRQLDVVAGVVEQLHAAVAEIERTCNDDALLVEKLNSATRRARISAPHERAIVVAEMRVAVGIFLRATWREPPVPADVKWGDLLQAVSSLVSVTGEGANVNLTLAPGSNTDIRDRLNAAQLCFDSAIGDAELARWISLQPDIRAGATEARRSWQNARRLLEILEETKS